MNIIQKIKLLVLFLLISITGFSQRCGEVSNRRKFRFKLLKKEGLHIDTTKIKLDGVYISDLFIRNYNNSNPTYYFYRFFKNGKVYMSGEYCSFPSESELNSLDFGSYGEYKVETDILIIESFYGYIGYFLKYYTISEGKITLLGGSKRKGKKPNTNPPPPKVIRKFYPCHLSSQPFW